MQRTIVCTMFLMTTMFATAMNDTSDVLLGSSQGHTRPSRLENCQNPTDDSSGSSDSSDSSVMRIGRFTIQKGLALPNNNEQPKSPDPLLELDSFWGSTLPVGGKVAGGPAEEEGIPEKPILREAHSPQAITSRFRVHRTPHCSQGLAYDSSGSSDSSDSPVTRTSRFTIRKVPVLSSNNNEQPKSPDPFLELDPFRGSTLPVGGKVAGGPAEEEEIPEKPILREAHSPQAITSRFRVHRTSR